MSIPWFDWCGYIGTCLVVLAFFLLQARLVNGHRLPYQLLNIVGAFGVVVSLVIGNTNWPALFMEASWVVIGIYGIVMARRSRSRSRSVAVPETETEA